MKRRRFVPGMKRPVAWSEQQSALFEDWVAAEEPRDSDPRLTRSSHAAPSAFDVARSDGGVDHYELRPGDEALDWLRRRRAEEVENGASAEAPRPIDVQINRVETLLAYSIAARPPMVRIYRESGADPVPFDPVCRAPRRELDGSVERPVLDGAAFIREADERKARGECPLCRPGWRCSLHEAEVVNRGRKREPEGQSALPRFSPYSIPRKVDPKAVDCPYCVKRPRNLREHCRAVHPDKPEARA